MAMLNNQMVKLIGVYLLEFIGKPDDNKVGKQTRI
jgi:hypothetical protein